MNQIAEDISQDEEIAAPLTVVETPKSEFVRPPYTFKGAELFPFTYGYEILFNQVRDPEDTGLFTWMAFIYLLRKREANETGDDHRKWAISIAWRVAGFRDSLITWMDDNGPFTAEDRAEAKRIFDESMKAIAETRVEAVPVRGRSAQKKTCRQKKRSSSISLETS
jgi:hypothetical protein